MGFLIVLHISYINIESGAHIAGYLLFNYVPCTYSCMHFNCMNCLIIRMLHYLHIQQICLMFGNGKVFSKWLFLSHSGRHVSMQISNTEYVENSFVIFCWEKNKQQTILFSNVYKIKYWCIIFFLNHSFSLINIKSIEYPLIWVMCLIRIVLPGFISPT